MGLHQMNNGATTVSKPATTDTALEKVPMKKRNESQEENDEIFVVPDIDEDEIEITDWVLS
jgi:hypothetical protein